MFATKSKPTDNTAPTNKKAKDPSTSYESEANIVAWEALQNEQSPKNGNNTSNDKEAAKEYDEVLVELKLNLLGDTSAYGAIQAYELIDNLKYKSNRDRLKKEHPHLMTLMFDNLPASYLSQNDIGFFEGISTVDDKEKKLKEGKSESRETSGVERMFELLNQPSTWINFELLEMVLSILGQPDDKDKSALTDNKEEDKVQTVGELTAEHINNLPETHKKLNEEKLELLAKYGFVAKVAGEKKTVAEADKNEEYSIGNLILHFIFSRKAADTDLGSKVRAGMQFGGLTRKAAKLDEIHLDVLQNDLGGHLGGMKFTNQDAKTDLQDDKTQNWLKEKGGEEFDQTEKLDVGAISYFADLKNGKAKLLAASLPFEKLDYIDNDLTIRGKSGAFRKLFLDASWLPPKRAEKKGLSTITLKVELGEVEMNQLRIIDDKETYGLGKLLVQNGFLNISTSVPSQILRNGQDFMFSLLDLLSNLGSIISGMSNLLISQIQNEGFVDAGNDLANSLAGGMFNNLSVKFNFGNLSISNFVGTEMGHIGDIQLGETSINIQPISGANQGDLTNEFELQKELQSNQEKLDKLKEKRSNRFDPSKKENEIDEKSKEVDIAKEELSETKREDKYKLDITSGSAKLKKAQIVEDLTKTLICSMIDDIQELDLGPILDFKEIEFKDLNISSAISPDETSNTIITISTIDIPLFKTDSFQYKVLAPNKQNNMNGEAKNQELYSIIGVGPTFKNTKISNLCYELGDYSEENPSEAINLSIDKLESPEITFDSLEIIDIVNSKKLGGFDEGIVGQFTLEGLQYNNTVTFNSVGFNLLSDIPVKGNTSYGQIFGEYWINELNFKYTTAQNDGTATNESKEKITLGAKLDFLNVPKLIYGKKTDEFYIRSSNKKDEAINAAIFSGIDVSVDYLMAEKKAIVNHFNVDEIRASNILVNYKETDYKLIGESKISGFYLQNLELLLGKEPNQNAFASENATEINENKGEERASVNLSKINAGFNSINIAKLWYDISFAQGLSAGKCSVTSVEDNKGMRIELGDLSYKNIVHQEADTQKDNNSAALKTLAKTEMEGSANVEMTLLDTGEKSLKFKMPKGNLSISKAYFNDGEGNYLTHNAHKTPLKIILPVFNVYILDDNSLLIKAMSIERIEAAGLRGKFGNINFEMPDETVGAINDIKAEDLQLTGGPIKGDFSTGKVDMQKMHLDISNLIGNRFITTPILKWNKLSFNGDLDGEYSVEITKPELGVGEASGKDEKHALLYNDYPNVRLQFAEVLEDTNLFEAASIQTRQEFDENGKKKQIITLKEPILKTTEINGDFFVGESEFDFEKVVLGGKVIGDLEIENAQDFLMINSVSEGGSNSLTLEEGKLVLSDYGLDKLSKGKDKEEKDSETPLDELYPSYTGMYDFLDGADGLMKLQLNDDGFFDLPITKGHINLDPFLSEVEEYILIDTDYVQTSNYKTKNEFTGKDHISYGVIYPTGAHTLINDSENNIVRIGKFEKELKLKFDVLRGIKPVPVVEFHQEYLAKISAIIDSQIANFAIEEEYNRRNNIEPENSKIVEYLIDKFFNMKPKINIEINNMDMTKLPVDIISNDDILIFFGNSNIENINLSFKEVTRYQKVKNGNSLYSKNILQPEVQIKGLTLPEFNFNNDKIQFNAKGIDVGKISYSPDKKLPKSELDIRNIILKDFNLYINKSSKE